MISKSMKKSFFSVLFCFCAIFAQAQTVAVVNGIRYQIEDDHAIIGRQDKELSGDIVIPASIEWEKTNYNVTGMVLPTRHEQFDGGVVEVEGGAFQECRITSITLPASIVVINDAAFSSCPNLASVTFLGDVTEVGDAAFSRCVSLESVTIPSTVKTLGCYAFGDCSALASINIPEGVTRLGDGCFLGTAISQLIIPASMKELCGYCLSISTLKKLTMNVRDHRTINYDGKLFGKGESLLDVSGVDLIVPNGSYNVYNTYEPWMSFKSITESDGERVEITSDQLHIVVDGVKYLIKGTQEDGYHAILKRQDASLSGKIVIPGDVPYADTTYPLWSIVEPTSGTAVYGGAYNAVGGAFQGTQIEEITLPNVQKIPVGTFADCANLTKVVLSEDTEMLGAACFANCTNLTTIDIPASVTDLGCETEYGYKSYVFGNCTSLKTVTIPDGVTKLADGIFKGSGIETLTIPVGITDIGEGALAMPQLKTLTLMQPDKDKFTIAGNAFGDDTDYLSQADLITPLGSAQVYREYNPWKYFRSINDVNCSYLKLDGTVFAAPVGSFTVEGTTSFEHHDAWFIDTYTEGLCIDNDTKISFTTTAEQSWVYIYLSSCNSSTVKLDGVEIAYTPIDDDQRGTYSFRRYDRLVAPGLHTITCAGYEGNQIPVMYLLEVNDASSECFEPEVVTTHINGIRYILKKTTVEDVVTHTATIGCQNTSLKGDIVIPEKVTYNGQEYSVTGFVEPSRIERFADGTVEINDGAFQGTAITSIVLPATIKIIASGAFFECRQLASVTLPEGLTQISVSAFARCESLEELFIPETVTDLGSDTEYGYSSYVFGGCTNLKKVNIPTSVTVLASAIFKDSGLETFLIPASVTTLEPYSFITKNLREFKLCHSAVKDLTFTESVFLNVDLSQVKLYVPTGAKNTFKDVYPWKDFEDIIEYTDQNDVHQYNAYRVEIEEVPDETPASVRRRAGGAATETTVGFTPSGVAPELPTVIEKDSKKYVVEYKEGLSVMPAQDVILKADLIELGDASGDGKVDIDDAMGIVDYLMGNPPAGFNTAAADMNGDGVIDIADAVIIVNLLVGE